MSGTSEPQPRIIFQTRYRRTGQAIHRFREGLHWIEACLADLLLRERYGSVRVERRLPPVGRTARRAPPPMTTA